jgi:UDP-N-acetylmuramoyl-L-alanyl-D-glutamate--2,6-diaminopimelate ligase
VDVQVTGITGNTSFVRPGDLFAALPGRNAHGALFAPEAMAAGAVAILTDQAGRNLLPAGVPVVVAESVREWVGPAASLVYGKPSSAMNVLGVTGTSGKTTTTFLIEAGLRGAGRMTGLVGTVGIHIGDEELKTDFTTPEAPELQALLAVMRERGVTDVAMEVSSHALALGRVRGTWFAVAGFTNLSEDHLDFHETMDGYFRAKAEFFVNDRVHHAYTDRRVVVIDDEWGRELAQMLAGVDIVRVSSAMGAAADWSVRAVATRPDGSTQFVAVGPDHVTRGLGSAIPGAYNVGNALLALAMLYEIGIEPDVVATAITSATVPGRMEPIQQGQDFLAIVDYSHKPAAINSAIRALRPLTPRRLIVVLGCGGDRDRGKRPHMGEIAARGADILIVTDDNPRSEDPAEIRRAMLTGTLAVPSAERADVREIGDRHEAILAAVLEAGAGDTVLLAGKGHEPGQEIAGVIQPFDDRDELRAALRAAGQS